VDRIMISVRCETHGHHYWRLVLRTQAQEHTFCRSCVRVHHFRLVPANSFWQWTSRCVSRNTKTNQKYIKHINVLYYIWLATCFDPYRIIIRPSSWIKSLKHSVHYWDPTNVYRQYGWHHV